MAPGSPFLRFRFAHAAALALATVCAHADVPDVTTSLEYVGNPAKVRWPANAYYRGVLDLQFHRGRLIPGSGEVENNPGPVYLHGIDPVTLDTRFEYSAGTEAIARFQVASWGDLLAPSQDPHEGDPNVGHVYLRGADGTWTRRSSIGGSVPYKMGSTTGSVASNTHVWDMEEFDGRVFSASYQLHWSTNHCANFVNTGSITNAYRVLYYMASDGGHGQWSLRRQMQLLRFPNDLYAVPNALIQPNYSIDDSNKWYNKVETFHWNPSTLKFDEGRQAMSTLFPNISSNDFRLVLTSSGGSRWDPLPTGTYDKLLVRLWHTTPFKGRVLYVGCYDTQMGDPALTSYPLPLMGCSAYVETTTSGSFWNQTTTKTLKATRLSFGGDKEEYPWDFTVVGDTCYALTSKPNANTKVVRHSVWKSTNGTSFTRVFSFDFHQNMISLDYRDGWFWLGVGVKSATRGYAYNDQADESGAIYRVHLPQEPTSVEAVDPPAAIAEGGSATIAFRLTAQPSSNLTLRVAARERQGVSLDRSSLTFTTANWSTPQTVTVSLADDEVGDTSQIVVQCGAFGDDVQRGEFWSPQVTSAAVILAPVENDIPATIASESFEPGVGTCAYRATYDSLGIVNGVAATSATVSVRVYSDASLATLAGETTGTVSATGTEQSFTVTGLERGVWYWLVAETTTVPGVSHTFTAKYLSPIATPEELVDLMDDADNRQATYANSTSGGATGSTAFDNKASNFGGYNKPVSFMYQFKTPTVVNGLGVWSMSSGDTDRHPSTINVYGGSSTNASDLVLLRTISESDWEYKEWRRWVVPNEDPYTVYRITLNARNQHCYVNELELYGIGVGGGDGTPVLGSCTAAVDGTNVAFSVTVRSVESPAAVSVFYGPDESHLAELSLGTASTPGTLTATATGLANGSYVWFARAVSTVDGTPLAAESAHGTFTVNWVPPPEGMLIADGFSADDYTSGGALKTSTGGDTAGFTTERKWSAKTVTGVLYVNNDGLSFPASWSPSRYPSGGYAAGFKSSDATTTSDIRGACRQLADGAFPTSGTIYFRLLLRHATGASHCPTDCYRAAGFLPQDFTSLGDQYAQNNGTTLFNKGLWLGTRGKGNSKSSINLRLGSQDLVLVDTMQEGVTYLCVAKMEINADGANETATGFAMPVDEYTAPVWTNAVLRSNVVGEDAPLAWFGIVGGYKTNNKYVSFDELAVSTILADIVPVPSAGTPPAPVFRAAADGGALVLDGATFSLNLVNADPDAFYAAFTNGTLAGAFFAAAEGVRPAAGGTLALTVGAAEPAKFVVVGASYDPIHEGDALVPAHP